MQFEFYFLSTDFSVMFNHSAERAGYSPFLIYSITYSLKSSSK